MIGYWARIHGLTYDDLCQEDWFREILCTRRKDNQDATDMFKSGYQNADEELREEARQKSVEELIHSLQEAYMGPLSPPPAVQGSTTRLLRSKAGDSGTAPSRATSARGESTTPEKSSRQKHSG